MAVLQIFFTDLIRWYCIVNNEKIVLIVFLMTLSSFTL